MGLVYRLLQGPGMWVTGGPHLKKIMSHHLDWPREINEAESTLQKDSPHYLGTCSRISLKDERILIYKMHHITTFSGALLMR